MNSTITSWLSNNWLALLGLIATVWVPIALRARFKLRFWTVGEGLGGSYIGGSTHTILNIRNAGKQQIDANEWRVPLSVECDTAISGIDLAEKTNLSGRDGAQRDLVA